MEREPTCATLEIVDDATCCRPGCAALAADDANECGPHRDERRARVRRSIEKKRAKTPATMCTRCCTRVRTKGRSWCLVCIEEQDRRRGKNVDANVNNKKSRVAANTTPRTTASNLGRVHYHGHGQRGRVSNAQLDAQDLVDAKRELLRAEGELAYAYSPEVQEMPRIQRLDEKRKAVSRVYLGVKFLLEVLDRHGENVVELLLRDGLIRE